MLCLVYCTCEWDTDGEGVKVQVCCTWLIIWMGGRGSVGRLCLVCHTDGRRGSRSAKYAVPGLSCKFWKGK